MAAPTVTGTSLASIGAGGGLIFVKWLVEPSWPPPDPVLTITVTAAVPAIHLLGRALFNRLRLLASAIDPEDDVPDRGDGK